MNNQQTMRGIDQATRRGIDSEWGDSTDDRESCQFKRCFGSMFKRTVLRESHRDTIVGLTPTDWEEIEGEYLLQFCRELGKVAGPLRDRAVLSIYRACRSARPFWRGLLTGEHMSLPDNFDRAEDEPEERPDLVCELPSHLRPTARAIQVGDTTGIATRTLERHRHQLRLWFRSLSAQRRESLQVPHSFSTLAVHLAQFAQETL